MSIDVPDGFVPEYSEDVGRSVPQGFAPEAVSGNYPQVPNGFVPESSRVTPAQSKAIYGSGLLGSTMAKFEASPLVRPFARLGEKMAGFPYAVEAGREYQPKGIVEESGAMAGSFAPTIPLMMAGGGAAGAAAKAIGMGSKAARLAEGIGSFAAMQGGSAEAAKLAKEPGSENISVLGETLKGGVLGGVMGPVGGAVEKFIPAAKTLLGRIGIKAPTDAITLSAASAIYDHITKGTPISWRDVGKDAAGMVPSFMVMNAFGGKKKTSPRGQTISDDEEALLKAYEEEMKRRGEAPAAPRRSPLVAEGVPGPDAARMGEEPTEKSPREKYEDIQNAFEDLVPEQAIGQRRMGVVSPEEPPEPMSDEAPYTGEEGYGDMTEGSPAYQEYQEPPTPLTPEEIDRQGIEQEKRIRSRIDALRETIKTQDKMHRMNQELKRLQEKVQAAKEEDAAKAEQAKAKEKQPIKSLSDIPEDVAGTAANTLEAAQRHKEEMLGVKREEPQKPPEIGLKVGSKLVDVKKALAPGSRGEQDAAEQPDAMRPEGRGAADRGGSSVRAQPTQDVKMSMRLKDGRIIDDEGKKYGSHAIFFARMAKKLGITVDDVQDHGWTVDGKYAPGNWTRVNGRLVPPEGEEPTFANNGRFSTGDKGGRSIDDIHKDFNNFVTSRGGSSVRKGGTSIGKIGKNIYFMDTEEGLINPATGRKANGLNYRIGKNRYQLLIDPTTGDITTTPHEIIHGIIDRLEEGERSLLAKSMGKEAFSDDEDESITEEIAKAVAEGREYGTPGSLARTAWQSVKDAVELLFSQKYGDAWERIKRLPYEMRSESVKQLIQSGEPAFRGEERDPKKIASSLGLRYDGRQESYGEPNPETHQYTHVTPDNRGISFNMPDGHTQADAQRRLGEKLKEFGEPRAQPAKEEDEHGIDYFSKIREIEDRQDPKKIELANDILTDMLNAFGEDAGNKNARAFYEDQLYGLVRGYSQKDAEFQDSIGDNFGDIRMVADFYEAGKKLRLELIRSGVDPKKIDAYVRLLSDLTAERRAFEEIAHEMHGDMASSSKTLYPKGLNFLTARAQPASNAEEEAKQYKGLRNWFTKAGVDLAHETRLNHALNVLSLGKEDIDPAYKQSLIDEVDNARARYKVGGKDRWEGVRAQETSREDDKRYLDLVRSGDMESAHRMVDVAAKKAGYTLGVLYHGTQAPSFNAFDKSKTRSDSRFHFTPDKDVALRYAGGTTGLQGYSDAEAGNIAEQMFGNSKVWELAPDQERKVFDQLKKQSRVMPVYLRIDDLNDYNTGKHTNPSGVKGRFRGDQKETGHYAVYDPEQIKSADPITRDDQGRVIPLSKRFRSKNTDIRYQETEEKPKTIQEMMAMGMSPEDIRVELTQQRTKIDADKQDKPMSETRKGLSGWFDKHFLAAGLQDRESKRKMVYTLDSAQGQADRFSEINGNDINGDLARALGKTTDKTDNVDHAALSFMVESGSDLATLKSFKQRLNALKRETIAKLDPKVVGLAKRAVDSAIKNFDAMAPVAKEFSKRHASEVFKENEAGFTTPIKSNYVMHIQDIENADRVGFMHGREYDTFVDSMEAGIDPKTLDAITLMKERFKYGQRMMNKKAWIDSLGKFQFSNGEKFVEQPVADTSVMMQRGGEQVPRLVPPSRNYKIIYVGKGTPIAIHKDIAGLFDALTANSHFRQSEATTGLMKALAVSKNALLMFDTFHLVRLGLWDTIITGSPQYKKGLLLLDHSPEELTKMAKSGEIDKDLLPGLLADRQKADLAVRTGYNVAHITDALHTEWVRKIPLVGDFNKFLFEQYQRGAMMRSWIHEFDRISEARPEANKEEIARQVSKDLNTRFGNLGRQGLFKSKTSRDLAMMVFLAPQWNQGLLLSEFGAVKQLGQLAGDAAAGRNLVAGTLLKSAGTLMAGMFTANQLINLVTRGKPTWENEEEGLDSKLSAWIPDKHGGSGFFMSPFSIAAEITHQLIDREERAGRLDRAISDVLSYKLQPLTRSALVFARQKDNFGRATKDAWDTIKTMGQTALPLPIGAPAIARGIKEAVTGKASEQFPGQYQKQAMASFGMKTSIAPSNIQRIQRLAEKWNQDHGVSKAGEFYASPYGDLTHALQAKNSPAAIDAYKALVEKEHKTPSEVLKYYKNLAKRQFTSSRKNEAKFIESLTDEQQKTYDKAVEDRESIADAFFDLINSPELENIEAPDEDVGDYLSDITGGSQ